MVLVLIQHPIRVIRVIRGWFAVSPTTDLFPAVVLIDSTRIVIAMPLVRILATVLRGLRTNLLNLAGRGDDTMIRTTGVCS